jgi:hypothetical protein
MESPELRKIAKKEVTEHDNLIAEIARQFEFDRLLADIEPFSDLTLPEVCARYELPDTLRPNHADLKSDVEAAGWRPTMISNRSSTTTHIINHRCEILSIISLISNSQITPQPFQAQARLGDETPRPCLS